MKICFVCGARPNFMKIAAIVEAAKQHSSVERYIVHTGQHYDERMYKVLFEDLCLPRPDVDLEVGSGSHASQTAAILERFEPILQEQKPDVVIVVGDTNSTLACTLAASKARIPVAHVEAGLRSFDRDMPEELNRLVTDQLSDLLFVSEISGMENLEKEGLPTECTHFVGNVMIDTLLRHRERAQSSEVLDLAGVKSGEYAALTLHRPSNVDDKSVLDGLLGALHQIATQIPLVFAVHPRTKKMLQEYKNFNALEQNRNFRLLPPQGYLDFVKLMSNAKLILTDSGGIQEESTALRVPCLTLRENTERPATVDQGSNRIVGTNPEHILDAFGHIMSQDSDYTKTLPIPEKWDGKAGERILQILLDQASNSSGYPAIPLRK